MPGIGTPIVIGGGIQLASPNAINEFLFVSSITPPAATTSPRLRISGSSLIMESAAGRDNTVIGPGATAAGVANTPEVLIGKNVTSLLGGGGGTGNLGIGQNIGFTAATGSNLIIGDQPAGVFPKAGLMGNASTIVGRVNSLGAAPFVGGVVGMGAGITIAASNVVVIGEAASVSGNDSIVIGKSANSSAGANVIIGTSAGAAGATTIIIGSSSTGTGTTTQLIAIGQGITVANLSSMIVVGSGASVSGLAAGDIVLGHNNNGGAGFSSRVVWGGANLHTNATVVPAWTFRHKNAQGNDIAAGSVTLIAPLATGNAAGGSFVFQTGPAGGAGAGLQVATTRLTISPNGVSTFGTPTAAAENIVIEGFGGAAQASVRFNNLTNGAGALGGTLLNSPVAGDPTFWIPVSIAGAVKHIPAW